MQKEFLTRPLDPATAKCWAELIRKFNEWMRAHPECVEWFVSTLRGLENDFFSALRQQSQDKIDEFHKMCLEYSEPRRAGKVGTPEIRALLVKRPVFARRRRSSSNIRQSLFQETGRRIAELGLRPGCQSLDRRHHRRAISVRPDAARFSKWPRRQSRSN
jgi:hypothetical protein